MEVVSIIHAQGSSNGVGRIEVREIAARMNEGEKCTTV